MSDTAPAEVQTETAPTDAMSKLGSWCRRSLANRCLNEAAAAYGRHVSTSTGGSLVIATMGLTVWSRDHGDRIPIRGALTRRWRSGSSPYAASSAVNASITGRRRSAGTSNRSFSRCRRPQRSVGSWWQLGWLLPNRRGGPKAPYRRFEADQPNECWQSDSPIGGWPTTTTLDTFSPP
jgi:hypothetical protein